MSVDLFANASNCLIDRFFSEYAEPKAETVDAIAVTDWQCPACPHCHLMHRETIFGRAMHSHRLALLERWRGVEPSGRPGSAPQYCADQVSGSPPLPPGA